MPKTSGEVIQQTVRLGRELHGRIRQDAQKRTKEEGIYCSLERVIVEMLHDHYTAPPTGRRETKKPIARAS